MATTTPNFGWAVPTSSDLVKNGATAIETLGDAIDASLVDLKGGTTGQVLSKASGTDMDFTWATPSSGSTFRGCAVYNAGGNVTYTGGVISILNFSTEDYDTNSYHDNSTNNSRITIPTGYAGKYLINQVWRVGVGVGYVITRLYKNGGSVNLGLEGTEMVRVMNQGSNSFGLNASVVLDLAVGDYIEMAVQTDYAGTSATYARFSASYLGA